MHMKKIVTLLLLLTVLVSCSKERQESEDVGKVDGYRPIYMPKDQALSTDVQGPEILSKPGKIYIVGSWLYLTDKGRGVHIIDISNLLAPKKHAFISVPGIEDVAVKGSYLFADNITDVVVFNIGDINNIQLSQRIEDVYPETNQLYPSQVSGYFECVDPSKGFVVGWEKVSLDNPKCWRN